MRGWTDGRAGKPDEGRSSHPPIPPTSHRALVPDLFLILLLGAVVMLPSFATRDLWNPDEPRYMEVSREMVALGDYLVPHLNGTLYAEKPPLFFWLTAGLYRLGFGLNAGRAVGALASMGTLLLTYALARRFLPRPGPLLAALATLTAVLFAFVCKTGVIDTLLACLATAAIYLGVRALDPAERNWRLCWLGAYASAGLAALTKGPIGVAVPALVLLIYAAARAARPPTAETHGATAPLRGGGWFHLVGVLCLLAIVAAWLVPLIVRVSPLPAGREYLQTLLVHQTTGRVINSYSHAKPPPYYLMILPGILFPWTLLLIPACASAARAAWREREPGATLSLGWALGLIILFSLISGKRPGYILPAVPAFGLLVGRYMARGMQQGFPWPRLHEALVRATLGIFLAGTALMAVALASAAGIARFFFPHNPEVEQQTIALCRGMWPVMLASGGAVAALALVGWWGGGRRRRPSLVCAAVVGIAVALSMMADLAVIPRANFWKSGRDFAVAVRPYLDAAGEAYLYQRDFSGVYNLYTGRLAMPVLATAEELEIALRRPTRTAVIGLDKELRAALGDPPRCGRIAIADRVGHRQMFLLTNWDLQVHNDAEGTHAPGAFAQ